MIIRRAAQRYETRQPGIVSRHCFSAGPHYDPANVSFGPVIGVDEHLVERGAGFEWHAHRGVVIVSYVVAGTLRHEAGTVDRLIGPGELFGQDARDAVRHRETNGRAGPLRFVQTTLTDDVPVEVLTSPTTASGHLFVVRGTVVVDGVELAGGDSVRAADPVGIEGSGTALLVRT